MHINNQAIMALSLIIFAITIFAGSMFRGNAKMLRVVRKSGIAVLFIIFVVAAMNLVH